MPTSSASQPLVSIIMATYNGEAYLKPQLESLLKQTDAKLEILIQDDLSQDNTWEILQEYAKKDSRIQLYQNQENLGIAKNFLSLIEKSKGDYIAISDQDDIWETHKISTLLQLIPQHSLAYSDSKLIDSQGAPLNQTLLNRLKKTPKEGKYLLDLFEHNTISGHSCLFCQSLKPLILENEKLWTHPESVYDMVLGTIASLQKGIIFSPAILTQHCLHEKNNQNQLSAASSAAKPSREPYVKRRIQRIKNKISKHTALLELLEKLSPCLSPPLQKIFLTTPSKNIPRSLFQIKLYLKLRRTELPAKTARKLCYGKWYFIMLKWL